MESGAAHTEFMVAARASLDDASFVKLTLGALKGALREREPTLKSIDIRPITVKRVPKLSFTYHHQTNDIVKNFDFDDAMARIADVLATGPGKASLLTTGFDLAFDGTALKRKSASQTAPAGLDHDRQKARLIAADGKPYLHALAITDKTGQVRKDAQDKYRQINRYVELLAPYLKAIPPEKLGKIVDMGSGKGYLTFALYDYLHGVLGLSTAIVGVEYRDALVTLCNGIAADNMFDALSFVQGSIADYDSANTNVMIALHACDTATDDAIAKGISAGAELIAVAPCCHKQIRREMEKGAPDTDLGFLLKHGIFTERQAEMVTDGIRAMILEYFGYTTKVFEFISDAHTPKNVLIVGVKSSPGRDPAILTKIAAAKSFFGITHHHLERATGIDA